MEPRAPLSLAVNKIRFQMVLKRKVKKRSCNIDTITHYGVRMYKCAMTYQTQQNFIMFIIVLGQHVSILIESSSGPSKIQILP